MPKCGDVFAMVKGQKEGWSGTGTASTLESDTEIGRGWRRRETNHTGL